MPGLGPGAAPHALALRPRTPTSRRPTALSRLRILHPLCRADRAGGGVRRLWWSAAATTPRRSSTKRRCRGSRAATSTFRSGSTSRAEKRQLDVGLSGPFQAESEAEYPELDMSATAKGTRSAAKRSTSTVPHPARQQGLRRLRRHRVRSRPDHLQLRPDDLKRHSGGRQANRPNATACQEAADELEIRTSSTT